MLNNFYDKLGGADSVSVIIISVAFMLIFGFLATRLTKLVKLPNVTAYILTGVALGPFCLDLIPRSVVGGMGFSFRRRARVYRFRRGRIFQV